MRVIVWPAGWPPGAAGLVRHVPYQHVLEMARGAGIATRSALCGGLYSPPVRWSLSDKQWHGIGSCVATGGGVGVYFRVPSVCGGISGGVGNRYLG